MQRLLELVPPTDPRDVPGSAWTDVLLADWLNRPDRSKGGDPYLKAIVDDRRIWRSYRELRCEWRTHDGEAVFTWQTERSPLGNPYYQMRIATYDARPRWHKRPHPADSVDRFVREGRRRSEEASPVAREKRATTEPAVSEKV